MDLKGKTAIVTGASSGLGISFSKKLIERGSSVYGLARNEAKLYEVKDQLGDLFHPVKLDITDPDSVTFFMDHEFNSGKRPDIVINNAGVGYFGKIEEMVKRV